MGLSEVKLLSQFPGISSVQSLVGGYAWKAADQGLSNAHVFSLSAEGRPALFVKIEERGVCIEIDDEAQRLCWLSSLAFPCPHVLAHVTEEGQTFLVMTALAGADLGSTTDSSPEAIVTLAANALAALHGIDPARCPFDHRAIKRVEEAGRRMVAGCVDPTDFDEARHGRPATELLDELVRTMPSTEDLVVTHGDACLPNLMAHKGTFTGYLDVGRLGVADRHQDLALMVRDIAATCGDQWIEPFLCRYGMRPDLGKMSFFQLLDEFF